MKAYYRILGLMFVLMFGGIFIANIIVSDKDFSELENRVLTQKPDLTFNSFIEGKYSTDVESYINDQFILRSNFVTLKSSVDTLLGKIENNNVFIGKDDYMFEEYVGVNEKQLNDTKEAINNFYEKHKDINISFMLVPNAGAVLDNKLPNNIDYNDELEDINKFGSVLNEGIKFVNPYNILTEHKDEYIFYKTDHHWTTLGAYYGYTALDNALNIKHQDKDKYTNFLVSDNFYGTLFSKGLFSIKEGDKIHLYLPKDEEDSVIVEYEDEKIKTASFYESKYLEERDKYATFLGGNHPIINIKTTADLKDERKILIFKDSYANCLIPFLTTHFTEITVVDPRYYYNDIEELIKQEEFNDILFLYNGNTFFQDNSLSGVLNNE